jgi:predicted component of type VI protein secretion system
MRSFLRSLLALFTLGMTMTGCSKSDPPPAPAPSDVTLHVPGMY